MKYMLHLLIKLRNLSCHRPITSSLNPFDIIITSLVDLSSFVSLKSVPSNVANISCRESNILLNRLMKYTLHLLIKLGNLLCRRSTTSSPNSILSILTSAFLVTFSRYFFTLKKPKREYFLP